MARVFAEQALLPDGWAADVLIETGADGNFVAVSAGAFPVDATRAGGPVIPGMANLHSHAFQRAMAGLAEVAGGEGDDSFWSWRRVMYGFVARLTPDQVHAIAARLYVEMLKQGYTSVGEFHYLHNRPGGGAYDDPAEMSVQVIEAALKAGIGITHLPVLYASGGFGGGELSDEQLRFRGDADSIVRMVEAVRTHYDGNGQVRTGLAPHSLRAVPPEMLKEAVSAVHAADPAAPIHIHIAEQLREVAECLDWSGRTPVDWLYENMAVDERWCLVHATNLLAGEITRLAESGAVAGLCPTTEANLGDGLFPLAAFLEAGGRFGIGSDAHVSVSPVEELRWLEYGQRLAGHRRAVAASPARPSVGATLWQAALDGGARALGRPFGAIAVDRRADLVVLDGAHPLLEGRKGDAILDTLIFAGNDCLVRDVMAGGDWVVEQGRHCREDEIAAAYRKATMDL